MNLADAMRQDWDARARKDAFHYIATWRNQWDPGTFFESGEEDYRKLVAPVLSAARFAPQGKSMLELGCGAGRMTRAFAQTFSRVYAFDISPEMLHRAKTLFPDANNIEWTLGNGSNLSPVSDCAVDFAFSYIVLHHMPSRDLALNYIREMLRVLKPGGRFLFQFSTLRTPTMNWKGRLIWRIVDIPWSLGFPRASRGLASLLRLPPEIAGKSWRGALLDVATVRSTAAEGAGAVDHITGEGTAMTWCDGVKIKAS